MSDAPGRRLQASDCASPATPWYATPNRPGATRSAPSDSVATSSEAVGFEASPQFGAALRATGERDAGCSTVGCSTVGCFTAGGTARGAYEEWHPMEWHLNESPRDESQQSPRDESRQSPRDEARQSPCDEARQSPRASVGMGGSSAAASMSSLPPTASKRVFRPIRRTYGSPFYDLVRTPDAGLGMPRPPPAHKPDTSLQHLLGIDRVAYRS